MDTFEIRISEGEDLVFPLEWAEQATGEPIDLTGSTIRFESNDPEYSHDALILDAVGGRYQFSLPASKTASTMYRGELKVIKYTVKHTSAGGITTFLFKIEVTIEGVND